MADEAGSLVLCGISHEALRDQANRAHFEGTNDRRFDVYQELLEQMASDAFDADASDQAGCVLVTKAPQYRSKGQAHRSAVGHSRQKA